MTRRLLLSYLSLTLFVLLLLELPLAVFFQQRETDRLSADLERDATVLATIFEDALESGNPIDPTPALDYAERTGARVVIVDLRGISALDTDIADQGNASDRDFSTRPEFVAALAGERAIGTRYSSTLDKDLLYVAVPVASGGEVHGAIRLTFDTSAVNDRVHAFWWGLVGVGGIILIVVAGVGWALSRSITRPIRHLQDTAARFSSGDLASAEPQRGAPAELVELERSMNVMATRLERLIGQQRSFVADASHQLRTPLTALRLRLENLQSGATDEAQHADIEAALNETGRLAHLVTDLLQLASAEKPAALERCDLVRLANDRLSTWTAVAEMSGVRLELVGSGDSPLWANCVPGGVEQILDNLLSNAIEVAPSGSTVEVELQRNGDFHQLSVIDHGPGLSADDRRQALERFWRAGTATEGTGLGLAIVRSLAEASGGSVRLDAVDPTGLAARVHLPAAHGKARDRLRPHG